MNLAFSHKEITDLIESSGNQSDLLNGLIQRISQRIYEEVLE